MTTNSSSSQRMPYWDNLKGLLIFLVVLGHYFWQYREYSGMLGMVLAIYVFHMPAFVFISGYFSKSEKSTSAETLVKFLIWFVFLNYSMMFYAYAAEHRPISLSQLYYSSWYLLAIFLYRLTLPFCRRIPFVIPLSIAISLGIGFCPYDVFALGKIIALYPFFIIGAKVTTKTMEGFVASLKTHFRIGRAVLPGVAILCEWLILRHIVTLQDVIWGSYGSASAAARRLLVLVLAGSVTVILLALTPHTHLPLVAKWGRNSLAIYVTHRIFTLLLALAFPFLGASILGWLALLIACMVSMMVLGSDTVSRRVTRVMDRFVEVLVPNGSIRHLSFRMAGILFVGGLVCGAQAMRELPATFKDRVKSMLHGGGAQRQMDLIHPTISPQQAESIRSAVSISFVGDLILLRDQVYGAYDLKTGEYNFAPLFQYASRYLAGSDLSVGVFEGPMAGNKVEYSTSTLHDGIPLRLNFPDSFARAIKAAGIGFVTTANNHVLDMGISGAQRTLDVLDQVGLAHAGSYRSEYDKAQRDIPVIEVKGLKLAILTYTYGSNSYPDEYFVDPRNSYLTSTIVSPASPLFAKSKEAVLNDFRRAKAKHPDTIVVLPHMGAYFSHIPDDFEKTWAGIFVDAGADLVVADHPHAVQPIEWRQTNRGLKKYSLIAYCAGNFVNSYIDYDGDATAIVGAYLDRNTGAPVAASVVPMWGQSTVRGLYRALPIYDIMRSEALQEQISSRDLARVKQVHSIVTRVMLGRDLSLDQVQERYYLFPQGYARAPVAPIELSERGKSTQLYRLLSNSHSACFIGDSVTEGTKNGGYGWYEPLTAAFPNLTVYKRAWGGYTIKLLLKRREEIVDVAADVYVIAVGTNDVRYRAAEVSSMTPEEFVANVDRLVQSVKAKHRAASFVFVGPWTTDHYDPVSALDEKDRMAMLVKYREALKTYADGKQYLYIDPNPEIDKVLRSEYAPKYLMDHIHPNADQGIRLYSLKVLEASR